jgi:hypothetical protein
VGLNQATPHWDTTLEQRIIHLPPNAGEGGDGGRAQAACGQPLHPHPGPPPSQGEGSLCANLMEPDLESQSAQTKAGDVLVFLGGEATHANTSHDRARLGVQNDEPALHRRQVRISHLGDRTALAL